MSPAQNVNNGGPVSVVIDRCVEGTMYPFSLSVAYEINRSNKQGILNFKVTPKQHLVNRAICSSLLQDLATKFRGEDKITKVKIDVIDYYVTCSLDLARVTPDKYDKFVADRSKEMLKAAKGTLVQNRINETLPNEEDAQ